MAIENLNKYKGLFATGAEESVVAASLVEAAELLSDELAGTEPTLLQCMEKGIRVLVPSNQIRFVTEVLPAEALAGGCIAAPEAYTVADGTEVIFSAIPAVGWEFLNWTRNGVVLKDTAVPPVALPATAVIAVTAGTPATAVVTYVANFVANP